MSGKPRRPRAATKPDARGPAVPSPAVRSPAGPLLIVSAFAPELAPLQIALRQRPGARKAVVCEPVGIGVVDAAAGAARAIARVSPRAVLFVGTAGSYGPQPPIGGVAVARAFVLASTAVARGDGYWPAPLETRAQADGDLGAALVRAARGTAAQVDVATTLAITRGASTARGLARATGAAVENLEAFAVARAAAAAGVPVSAVLGISNRVGPHAHDEWRTHQRRAASAACAVVAAFLDEQTALPRTANPTPTAAKAIGAPRATGAVTAPSRSRSEPRPRPAADRRARRG